MSQKEVMIGEVSLYDKVDVIPNEGLNLQKVRVELCKKGKEEGWITELQILGDLPWLEGEKRKVNVRIMSNEFSSDLLQNRFDVTVRYGSSFIGELCLL